MTSVNAELFHRELDKYTECRKCDGHGLVAGDDEDGVYFDTCEKCNGTGYVSSTNGGANDR
jgi:DnaJ-class molecular chaperone